MSQGEHCGKISTDIKLSFIIKIFVLFVFDWPFYAGFTALISIYYVRVLYVVTVFTDHICSPLSLRLVVLRLVSDQLKEKYSNLCTYIYKLIHL